MSILSKGFFLTEFTGFTRWIFFVGVDSISTLCIFKHFGKNEILPLQIYLWQLGTCNVSLQPNIFRVCHRQNPYNIFLCTGFPLGNPVYLDIFHIFFYHPYFSFPLISRGKLERSFTLPGLHQQYQRVKVLFILASLKIIRKPSKKG